MIFERPIPFNEAVRRLDAKSPVASALSSAEWAEVPLAIRERAQFSSRVTSLEAMQSVQDKLRAAVDFQHADGPFMDRSKFIAEMREVMDRTGMTTGKGGLTDPGSRRRLGLIYDFQLDDVHEGGRWKMGQSPALLRAFPARELLRVESRDEPRDWPRKWAAAGGKFYRGRMIARVDDPIWVKPLSQGGFNRFGKPWKPFDYQSGIGTETVPRREAIELGVIAEGDPPPAPQDVPFNQAMERSVAGLSEAKIADLKQAFGESVAISGDRAVWIGSGQVLEDAFGAALANTATQGEILLGSPLPAIRAAHGMTETAQKAITPDTMRHIHREHGLGNERAADQLPVTAREIRLLGAALDEPEHILPAAKHHQKAGENRMEHVLPINGVGTLHLIVRITAKRLSAVTAWIKKRAPQLTPKAHSGNQPPVE